MLLATVLPALLGLFGCSGGESPKVTYPDTLEVSMTLPDGPGLRVLFLGNSLTYSHNLPATVQAMAQAGGVKLHYLASTPPNMSLEDHWNHAPSRKALTSTKWDFVVLQQGPSTLRESQANLKQWAGLWADEIRKHNARPALYMVWPTRGQTNGFKLASQSYRNAAVAAKAQILPAGEAWEEALRDHPGLALYEDNLHPTEAGTYLTALIITHELTGVTPDQVPATLKVLGTTRKLPEAQAAKLREVAAKIIARNRTKEPAK